MNTISGDSPLALLTDLYQLTMASGYLKDARSEKSAVFHLFFRKNPFGGGYTIAAGLEPVLEFLRSFRFSAEDIQYLAQVTGNDMKPLFDHGFLDYLTELRLTVDIDAIPEGTVVFPHEPLIRVRGPMLQCQLLETALLNIVNFQSLIATKASRVVAAAEGDPVLEFGLRRAQGIDGAMAATRAAYIGGCSATSNVLAGKQFGIPVKGTHAHSWVMSFGSEPEAFAAYADAMPNNCVFLVDTYDTLQGVHHAVHAGKALRQRGHRMVGIRLDSGDLLSLSKQARSILDRAGFHDVAIVASNDLDEYAIQHLKKQGAAINIWGVGTKLVTAYDQPALGGVYKLGAVEHESNGWLPKVKVSEEWIKSSTPGIQQVRRYHREDGSAIGDVIYNELDPPDQAWTMVELDESRNRMDIPNSAPFEDLLVPVLRSGQRIYQPPELPAIRDRAFAQLLQFDPAVRRLDNPVAYSVGLEQNLHELKSQLMVNRSPAEQNESQDGIQI